MIDALITGNDLATGGKSKQALFRVYLVERGNARYMADAIQNVVEWRKVRSR